MDIDTHYLEGRVVGRMSIWRVSGEKTCRMSAMRRVCARCRLGMPEEVNS